MEGAGSTQAPKVAMQQFICEMVVPFLAVVAVIGGAFRDACEAEAIRRAIDEGGGHY
jgi:hypothetical protein